jgi:hypothetical protein
MSWRDRRARKLRACRRGRSGAGGEGSASESGRLCGQTQGVRGCRGGVPSGTCGIRSEEDGHLWSGLRIWGRGDGGGGCGDRGGCGVRADGGLTWKIRKNETRVSRRRGKPSCASPLRKPRRARGGDGGVGGESDDGGERDALKDCESGASGGASLRNPSGSQ